MNGFLRKSNREVIGQLIGKHRQTKTNIDKFYIYYIILYKARKEWMNSVNLLAQPSKGLARRPKGGKGRMDAAGRAKPRPGVSKQDVCERRANPRSRRLRTLPKLVIPYGIRN
jgi:hypothetical protein